MKEVIERVKQDYDSAQKEASQAWATFDARRKEIGAEKLATDEAAFTEVHELHRTYGEAAEKATALHERLMQSLAMDGDGPVPVKDAAAALPEPGMTGPQAALASKAAHAFVQSEAYKALVESGALKHSGLKVNMNPVEVLKREELRALVKGLVTGASSTSGGAFIINDRQAGLIDLPRNPRPILSLIGTGDTDSDTVEYVEMTARVNSAAETAEATSTADAAAVAPESGFDLVVRTSPVREIKHYIPATRISLADAGQLRSIIEDELMEGLLDRLEVEVLTGNGTGVNLTGLMNAGSGIASIATGASEPDVEAVYRALTAIAISGYTPEAVGFHPTDWQAIRLAKDANDNYYYGPPAIAGPSSIWGYQTFTSVGFTVGTALAGNFSRGAKLWIREGASTSATDSHDDWFLKGIIAVLANMRAAFAVQRPLAFRKITALGAT